jgi:putative transposase
MTVSKLVEQIKKSSSAWMKKVDGGCPDFAWQAGYGAFSIAALQIDRLIRYIEEQQEHHHVSSFEEEFVELLHRHGVEHDERYVWD